MSEQPPPPLDLEPLSPAARLRVRRAALGVKQKDLAQLLGEYPTRVSEAMRHQGTPDTHGKVAAVQADLDAALGFLEDRPPDESPQDRLDAALERCRLTRRDALERVQRRAAVPLARARPLRPVRPAPVPFWRAPTTIVSPARPAAQWIDPTTLQTGATIRARREALGLSQRALAEQAHVGRGTLAELEHPTRDGRHGASPAARVRVQQTLDRLERERAAMRVLAEADEADAAEQEAREDD